MNIHHRPNLFIARSHRACSFSFDHMSACSFEGRIMSGTINLKTNSSVSRYDDWTYCSRVKDRYNTVTSQLNEDYA